MVKAVIFDLDGVITDTAELHYQAWKDLADSISIFFAREFNEQLKGISRMDSLNKILIQGGLADQYNEQEKIALAEKKNKEYIKLLVELTPEHIYSGIKELLDDLKENGVKIGLASASLNGPAILEHLKITEYFDTIVNPNSVKQGKPAPDIFLRAAKDLDVAPSDCIGIEDSEAGICSIKRANMFAVGVGTVEVMKQAGADLIINDTKNLNWSDLLDEYKTK
ncbi:beta-phosphoglucomutase [Peribacillus muralis]|uniref:beta-phosphoglucomutase n=1 Tax=Peribacillus muralis TaxID=264697 RepID=UPI00070BDA8E|nr:beta-phosphoglucomutase [Peribacillus muralis]